MKKKAVSSTPKLFSHGNIVLNYRTFTESEFSCYASAFHEAAQALVNRLNDNSSYSDLDACPIMFLYRHSLELYLKAVVIIGNNLLSPHKKMALVRNDILSSHKITRLLPAVEKIFKGVGWKWEEGLGGFQNYEEFGRFISRMESIDPQTDAFRYPIKRTGFASLPSNFRINIPEYAKEMDGLLELLDSAVLGLNAKWDEAMAAS